MKDTVMRDEEINRRELLAGRTLALYRKSKEGIYSELISGKCRLGVPRKPLEEESRNTH